MGLAFLLAIIPATLGVMAMEIIVHLPGFDWLDSVEPAIMLRQLPILVMGLVVYAAAMFSAYRVSARRFERVDL